MASAKQIAWRKKFAKMAKSGKFRKSKKSKSNPHIDENELVATKSHAIETFTSWYNKMEDQMRNSLKKHSKKEWRRIWKDQWQREAKAHSVTPRLIKLMWSSDYYNMDKFGNRFA